MLARFAQRRTFVPGVGTLRIGLALREWRYWLKPVLIVGRYLRQPPPPPRGFVPCPASVDVAIFGPGTLEEVKARRDALHGHLAEAVRTGLPYSPTNPC